MFYVAVWVSTFINHSEIAYIFNKGKQPFLIHVYPHWVKSGVMGNSLFIEFPIILMHEIGMLFIQYPLSLLEKKHSLG